MTGKHILYISYKSSALLAREAALINIGCAVTTVLGSDGLMAQPTLSDYLLVILGEGPSPRERRKVIRWIRVENPSVPILALGTDDEQSTEADCFVQPSLGNTWLELVALLLEEKRGREHDSP